MNIEITYGVLSDNLELQLKKQGFTLGDDANKIENIRKAIETCGYHVASTSQMSSMYNNLNNLILKKMKPLN